MNRKRSVPVSAFAVFAVLLMALGGCDMFLPTGTITGTVYDSTASGGALSGVAVTVTDSWFTTSTDGSGVFTLTAPARSVTLHFEKTGYSFTDVTVVVTANQSTPVSDNIVAYHPLSGGQYRFVLSWGAAPSDLDSHLLVPVSGAAGGGEDVYFSNQNASDHSAQLDWDDTSSYGPETITITSVLSGSYSYSIYNYSGSPDMGSSSSAIVRVYDSTGLIKTLNITDAPGASASTDRWWRVFTFLGSTKQFTWLNAMSATGPGG